MRGIIKTDQTIEDVTALVSTLGYSVRDMCSALALAEQLRLVRGGMAVSQLVLSPKEKRPYSVDLGPLSRKIKADVGVGMASKSATACP